MFGMLVPLPSSGRGIVGEALVPFIAETDGEKVACPFVTLLDDVLGDGKGSEVVPLEGCAEGAGMVPFVSFVVGMLGEGKPVPLVLGAGTGELVWLVLLKMPETFTGKPCP